MQKLLPTFLLLLISLPLLASDRLVIQDPWTPEAPPGRMMAGFMSLHNASDQDIVLVHAESPQFGHVEIHTMVMDDGVMRMRRLEKLVIPAGESVALKPGGLHLMLMQPRDSYQQGDVLEVVLIAEDDGRYTLKSEVRPRQGMRSN